ncbi:hypothetical protein WR25_13201 [Diploscapter pachys]|uniref:NR LBD domain-containing protein n=1 Tax=Diploscapter pachys TaxID=2018661 RepID=A0A2A2KYK2_9BILA|nr:hypothetical protein WR25_13201 [Diploscapter pachys]
MPGGRNANAIYSIYKQRRERCLQQENRPESRPSSVVTQKNTPPHKNLIQELIEIDRVGQLINLRGLRVDPVETASDIAPACQRLSRIGDEIIEQLVQWTKSLPFYSELPVDVHTHLLTQRWPELVLLSACYYASSTTQTNAVNSEEAQVTTTTIDGQDEISFTDPTVNILLLQKRLSAVMGKTIPLEHVVKEAGILVENFTSLLNSYSKLNLTTEAYVCIKAITLLHLNQLPEGCDKLSVVKPEMRCHVQLIQDQFVKALQIELIQQDNAAPFIIFILRASPLEDVLPAFHPRAATPMLSFCEQAILQQHTKSSFGFFHITAPSSILLPNKED